MRLPSKFNGYSADGVRLYNDPATRTAQEQPKAPPAPYEVTELTNNYNARIKEFNADIANRLKETNLDFTNRIKATQADYNQRIKDMQAQFAQATKDENAELASIKNAQERAARAKEINADRAARAKELAAVQKEMPTVIANLQKEQKAAITGLNTEKTNTLKELSQAFNDTKSYITTSLQRGETPTNLDLMTTAQRREVQNKQAAAAQKEAQARMQAEAQARAQADAARQAQMQKYIDEANQISQQRRSQNYAQTYNLLTQNMPIPVGYQQPATSRQALTTMIGAGGEDQGIMRPQMSPAQLAQLASMNRGAAYAPPPQSVQEGSKAQAPTPAKRGGIMGKF